MAKRKAGDKLKEIRNNVLYDLAGREELQKEKVGSLLVMAEIVSNYMYLSDQKKLIGFDTDILAEELQSRKMIDEAIHFTDDVTAVLSYTEKDGTPCEYHLDRPDRIHVYKKD